MAGGGLELTIEGIDGTNGSGSSFPIASYTLDMEARSDPSFQGQKVARIEVHRANDDVSVSLMKAAMTQHQAGTAVLQGSADNPLKLSLRMVKVHTMNIHGHDGGDDDTFILSFNHITLERGGRSFSWNVSTQRPH